MSQLHELLSAYDGFINDTALQLAKADQLEKIVGHLEHENRILVEHQDKNAVAMKRQSAEIVRLLTDIQELKMQEVVRSQRGSDELRAAADNVQLKLEVAICAFEL